MPQALSAALLAGCEGVAAPLEGVGARAQFQPQGGAVQFQDLAEAVDEVAAVAIRQGVGLLAVNDDDGGIAAPLVGIAQLDAATIDQGWLMFLNEIHE